MLHICFYYRTFQRKKYKSSTVNYQQFLKHNNYKNVINETLKDGIYKITCSDSQMVCKSDKQKQI